MGLNVAAVVLAAGPGSRFEGASHKLLSEVRGRPLLHWAVTHAVEAGIGPVVVVAGAVDAEQLASGLEGLDVELLDNPQWAAGMATSLQAAIGWAGRAGVDALVIGLGDQPAIEPAAWRAVATADPAADVAVASYDGVRMHPVRLSRAVWGQVPTTGDAGARELVRGSSATVVEVPCTGSPADIDTLEDLQQWS